jgi:hypothetical protein
MSKTTILANGQITPTDALRVELQEPDEFPATILIVWPQAPSESIREGSVQLRMRSHASWLRPPQSWQRSGHSSLNTKVSVPTGSSRRATVISLTSATAGAATASPTASVATTSTPTYRRPRGARSMFPPR